VSEAVSNSQQFGLGRLAQTSMLPMALIAFILMMVVPIPAVLLQSRALFMLWPGFLITWVKKEDQSG